MSFKVTLTDNQLSRTGRPAFLKSTNENIIVQQGEDRRHILHGATQITDVLIDLFNRIIRKQGISALAQLIDGFLSGFRQRGISFKIAKTASLVKKVEKVIIIAFSKEQNLVAGSAVQNQGIEKARETIHSIWSKLTDYCAAGSRNLAETKTKALSLIVKSLSSSGDGEIAKYRVWILKLLEESVKNISKATGLFKLLSDFEFSCTLDIVHNGTTKEQNIWGLQMAGRLHRAILLEDEETIYEVLL
jgi:hypothetical protein